MEVPIGGGWAAGAGGEGGGEQGIRWDGLRVRMELWGEFVNISRVGVF